MASQASLERLLVEVVKEKVPTRRRALRDKPDWRWLTPMGNVTPSIMEGSENA